VRQQRVDLRAKLARDQQPQSHETFLPQELGRDGEWLPLAALRRRDEQDQRLVLVAEAPIRAGYREH